jgi:tRNA modification GTPase
VEAGGITLRLADTAGLRDASDEVEQVGIERARGKMQEAELVIFVCDGSRPMEADEAELVEEIKELGAAKIAVVNKIDKGETVASLDESAFDVTVTLSAKTGEGVEKLHDAIAKLWGSEKISLTDDAVIWNARQRASLSTAYELLSDAAAALKLGAPPDAACTMAESALSALSELDGRGVCEDIVAEVFARFCVGK